MKISIITTIYKAENTLPRLLDSMMAQKSQDLEFFLIDNGSPDRCGEICHEYAKRDCRFKIKRLKENIGYIGARNLGVQIVEADYISFCDSDDYLEIGGYDRAIEVINNTNCDLYMTSWKTINDGSIQCNDLPYSVGCYEGDKIESIILPQAFGRLKTGGVLHGFAWKEIIRRQIILDNSISFDEQLKPYEDQIYNISIIKECNRIIVDDIPLYNYVVNQNSITSQLRNEQYIKDEYQRFINLYLAKEKLANESIERIANCNETVEFIYEWLVNCSKIANSFSEYSKSINCYMKSELFKAISRSAQYGVSRGNSIIKFCVLRRLTELLLFMIYYSVKKRDNN